MGKVWLPSETDFAKAFREPSFLVPKDKPVGNVRIRPRFAGRAFVWLFSGTLVDVAGQSVITKSSGQTLIGNGLVQIDGATASSELPWTGDINFVGDFAIGFDITFGSDIRSNFFGSSENLLSIYCGGTTVRPITVYYSGGPRLTSTDQRYKLENKRVTCLVSRRSGVFRLYIDGILDNSSTYASDRNPTGSSPLEFLGDVGYGAEKACTLHSIALLPDGLTEREEIAFSTDMYATLLESDNDTPFLISVPAGGGAAYDETFAASAASAVTLTDAWSLNYSETYTASAAAALALTDAWLLDFAETYGANASGDLALTDSSSLNYSEAYAVGAAADLALADAWALDYAETLIVTATGDLALSNAYAVGNNYDESFSVAAVAGLSLTDVWAPHYGETLAADATAALALTDTWQLDYAETLAASAAAELLLSDAYDSPAPGAYDETFTASAIAALDLTHLFTTPNALPAGINHLTAMRVGGFFAVKP